MLLKRYFYLYINTFHSLLLSCGEVMVEDRIQFGNWRDESSYHRFLLSWIRPSFHCHFHPSGQLLPFLNHFITIHCIVELCLLIYNRRALSMVSFTLWTMAWRMTWSKPLMRVRGSSHFHQERKWSWPARNLEVILLRILL